jgi:hypothetical protein
MAEGIEVGDLVRSKWFDVNNVCHFTWAVVTEIEGDRIHGAWADTEDYARDLARTGWPRNGFNYRDEVEIVAKAKAKTPAEFRGTCVCKTQDLWRVGCKCGAIVPYAVRAR